MAGKKLPQNITMRKDGRYMGRFSYNGKTYTLYGEKDENPSKLKKRLDNLRYEIEHGIEGRQDNLQVDDLYQMWINDYKVNNKKGSIQTYKQVYTNMIQKNIGNKKIANIKNNHIQSLLNDLSSKYSQSRVQLAHVVIHSMFEVAVVNRFITENPAKYITLRKKETAERRVMSQQEQDMFLRHATNSIYYDVYVLALFSGMRIGEILALQWSDVDFNQKMINVTGTLIYFREDKKRTKDKPKTISSIRSIPMTSNVVTMLKTRHRIQQEYKLSIGNIGYTDLDYVFAGDSGEPYWDTAIRVDMKKIVAQINGEGIEFKPITPHTFRHSFATRCLELGVKPKVLQKMMGHSSFSMTMDLYGHVLEEEKQSELEKLEKIV